MSDFRWLRGLDLLEVLFDPSQLLEDGMFFRIDTIKPKVGCTGQHAEKFYVLEDTQNNIDSIA